MTLEDWLGQKHSLAEQLKVVEGLCTALNEAHQRKVLHRALEPANVEVLSDGSCDLQGAVRPDAATPAAARYRAPEVLEGAPYSPRADIYSVGVICYEMLSGQNPSGNDRPQPLSELRPDVPRDLTDAIMGCLERGPDWRPRDLSYLLQVVGSTPGAGATAAPVPAKAPEPPRGPVAASRKPLARRASSRNSVPLFGAVLVILLGAAGGAWFWLQSQDAGVPQTAAPAPPPVATPSPQAIASATPSPVAAATPPPKATTEAQKPASPEPAREDQWKLRVPATPTPPPRPTAEPTPVGTRLAEAAPPPPTPTPRPQESSTSEAAVLTALSPLSLKRPTTAMLDLRGLGLRPDHQAHFMKIKAPTNGITVVKQRYVGPMLIQVVVKVDETAAPGTYGLIVQDAQGTWSNQLVFTVTK